MADDAIATGRYVALPVVGNPAVPAGPEWPEMVNAHVLEQDLRKIVRGEVRFDDGTRAMYSTDASNYRLLPIGVVLPLDREDVIAAVAICRRHGAPILARGGGTSIPGQCCNVAVVLDMSKYYNRLLEIDAERRIARVEPGIVLDALRDAANRQGLTFGPDPATHNRCTLGGMMGNNSCGIHSVMAGRTVDNIEELEILTYEGEIIRVGRTGEAELKAIIAAGGWRGETYRRLRDLRERYAELIRKRYPDIPRRVSGYNLDQLLPENDFNVARALIGTEGTCVIILQATLRLVENPRARTLLVLGYDSVYNAADHITTVLRHGPIGVEGLDSEFMHDLRIKQLELKNIRLMPPGHGWLLIEFGGDTRRESDAKARALMKDLCEDAPPPGMKLFDDPEQERMLWEVRESGLGATAHVPGQHENWEGWEDSAVPPERLSGYLCDLRDLLKKFGYHTSLYGHFGDGCVHARMDWDLRSTDGIERWKSFLCEAADLVLSYGGSLSGEHGDGQARGWLLPKMYGDELVAAFREFKSIWDPGWKMNPGKVVDPYAVDENLRLGTSYDPWEPETHFAYSDDNGSFASAMRRCVGAAVCRRKDGGTMCPSYMVTHEEKHSTRGRARVLFEMLQGDPINEGWRSEPVREALDLCLSCKGCKDECPVRVDMAAYKAEFLSHYYEGRLRPRHAYAFGLIHIWAGIAARMPRLMNFITHAPILGDIARRVVNMHPERSIPRFAPQTFKEWFRKRPRSASADRPEVLLWPDTFNNHFHPETARAAVEVLEAAGFHVVVPERDFCCGRPLYDYGMLHTAKRWLREILEEFKPRIKAGLPFVVLEPSCAAVFRDELPDLFPHDENARRLCRQTFLLSEFLEQKAPGYTPSRLSRTAVVHGHCHHKAIMGMDDETSMLDRMGLNYTLLDSGCCGMAGAFGFEHDHYEISVRAGERVLLPAVRSTDDDALIVADGFSCREQIAQQAGRRALHLAEVLRMAMDAADGGGNVVKGTKRDGRPELPEGAIPAAVLIGGAALLTAGLVFWKSANRRKTADTKA